jgi:hypothetical protein
MLSPLPHAEPSAKDGVTLLEGHDGDAVQRGLAVEQDDVPIVQMALHAVPRLQQQGTREGPQLTTGVKNAFYRH